MNRDLIGILMIMIFGIVGCSSSKTVSEKKTVTMDSDKKGKWEEVESIYWVNSQKVDCVGVGPMRCTQVQKGAKLGEQDWEFFYDEIEGFDYEEGYIYKLMVKETSKPKNEVPADASSIRYELLEVLDKQKDAKLRLHDIWALESIGGEEIDWKIMRKHPSIEINLTTMKVMGNDGCNSLRGDIEDVGAKELIFGALAGTRMACPKMELSNRFNQQMGKVRAYQLKGLKLYLLDAEGNELLRFRKID